MGGKDITFLCFVKKHYFCSVFLNDFSGNMKKKILINLMLLLSVTIWADDVVYLSTQEFRTRVFDYTTDSVWHYKGDKPCIIDFYTTWCGPCKRLAPIMEELAAEYCDKIVIYKVDTERERELAMLFRIRSIPTLLFCPLNGIPQLAQGALPKEMLEKAIDDVLLKP